MKKKVLLLNLPGKEKYLREYFCSKISKARYYYPAVNLVYLSWWFSEEEYSLFVWDAIAEWTNNQETLDKIQEYHPDYIYFLASAPSFKEDKIFISELKHKFPHVILIWDGDIFRELKEESFVIMPELDAINFNFWSSNILDYMSWAHGQILENVIYKYQGALVVGKENFKTEFWNVPIPRWELFDHNKYNHPFAIRENSTVALTDFGCAFHCSFCPFSNIDWSLRPLDIVIEELSLLKKQGINDIFFLDETFGVNRKRTLEFCRRIKDIDMSRCVFCRVDVVHEDIVKEMKLSWCHTIIFGIESANEELLKKYNKNTTQGAMISAMRFCKKYHLITCGTFIIGLPGDTKASIENTIRFAKKLNLDFASFNIATPRIGTDFRQDMISQWWANPKDLNLESAKQKTSSWDYHEIKHNDILKLQSYAIRSFYLDPRYLIKRIFHIRTFIELKNLVLEWFYLIFKR